MKYEGDGELLLHGFFDSDWDGYASSRKSTFGYCETFFTFYFYLGLDSASIFVCVIILWYLCPFHILGTTSGVVANFFNPQVKKMFTYYRGYIFTLEYLIEVLPVLA
jgi:hypothetical protein